MPVKVAFGDWVLDGERRQLLRGGILVPVTPKAYQLLELLLERRPSVVSKAEVYERLWPKTFVAEVNLSRLMFELRAALGDDARRPRWLRTVRGFGYAFAGDAPAKSTFGAGWCRLILPDREIRLDEGENVLGRSHEAKVWLRSTSVSRRHARIVVRGQSATLEDVESKNGTFRGTDKVTGPVALADGDPIRVGAVSMSFRIVPPEGSTETRG